MSDSNNITTKEISPGILLHKQQITSQLKINNELIYIFKVELQKLNTLEFTSDFRGSENVLIENADQLITVHKINPYSSAVVAKLILKKDWKLKSKFKFTLKPASKEFQIKYIQGDILKLRNEMQQNFNILQKYPISLMPLSDVFQILNCHQMRFIDFEFPPIEENIYSSQIDNTNLETLIQWRKPSDFMIDGSQNLKGSSIFSDSIEPADIKQGILGDHYFASALAILAERPALIERLFITKDINPQGIYRIKFCKNGEWVSVTVDDFFPCHPLGGPIFTKSQGNELWVLLLEKAYAKIHGNYFCLRGGYTNEAMIDLTGCPSITHNFDDEEVSESIKNSQFWDIIKTADEEGYLLSASTAGEERWSDLVISEDGENGFLPAHAYAILQVKEYKNNGLLNIRNPWGNFEWDGDWSNKSNLWTQDAINILKPSLEEDDGSIWMCKSKIFGVLLILSLAYQDFVNLFKSLNICKVKNWDEVRIKGKFIKVQDIEDSNIEVVMSKWYYSVDINEKTRIIISLHQEDERIQGVVNKRPYLDVGIAILLKTADGNITLHEVKDLQYERQIELEVDLDPGSYIILPRTTGCILKRPGDAFSENIKMMDKNGKLNEIVLSTIKDVFRKYDLLLTNELTFVEFKGFYECINKTINQPEFESNILNNYSSSQKGLTVAGFIEFFKDNIITYGEEKIFSWFELLGYDRDLYSIRSRCFMLTFHSDSEISVIVRDNVQTDLDNRTNVLIVSKYGKKMDVKQGVQAFYALSKNVHAYTYAIVNEQNTPIEVTLDCSGSKNMICSTKSPIVKKRIDPGVLEFLLHVQAIPSVDNFVRSAKCFWNNINE